MTILVGMSEICTYMRIPIQTAYRWMGDYQLPVGWRPDGVRVTSTALLDAWIIESIANPPTRAIANRLRRNDYQQQFGPAKGTRSQYSSEGAGSHDGTSARRDAANRRIKHTVSRLTEDYGPEAVADALAEAFAGDDQPGES
jgi:hypothetical protein